MLSSDGIDNSSIEGLSWCVVLQGCTWAVVDFVGNDGQVGLVGGDGAAFGQVFVYEFVGVLVQAGFLGDLGWAK